MNDEDHQHRRPLMPALKDLSELRFGRLVAISRAGRAPSGIVIWTCRCDCGRIVDVHGDCLRAGVTRSCGCLRRERCIERSRKHGHAPRERRTSTWTIWQGMIKRCTNPKCSHFKYYGGRGITVCDRWRNSFDSFLADMGERPDWATGGIDRIDVDGNYEPSNCRWSTTAQQHANRRDSKANRHRYEGADA